MEEEEEKKGDDGSEDEAAGDIKSIHLKASMQKSVLQEKK